jgi:hypothetical protein
MPDSIRAEADPETSTSHSASLESGVELLELELLELLGAATGGATGGATAKLKAFGAATGDATG